VGTFVVDALPDAETIFVAEGTGRADPVMLSKPCIASGARCASSTGRGLDSSRGLAALRAHRRRRPPARVFDEAIRRWVDGDADRSRHVVICGVGAPVLALRDRLRGAGYARRAVQYERW
jgi:ferredoxin-NADP reductase